MALTFLDTVFEQYSSDFNANVPVMAGGALASADEASSNDWNAFYAGVIRSLNECIAEGDACEDATAAESLIENEPLARREWKRLLDRVLSGPVKA
jgi:hypothetical protein